ncbi:Ig-like domain-containing protein, partial [Bacillus sp. D-CC]
MIKGLYGTLYINKDGVYRYVLNGSVDSNGQVDDFTYTLSDGTQSDTAVLTISVEDVIAPKTPSLLIYKVPYKPLITASVPSVGTSTPSTLVTSAALL